MEKFIKSIFSSSTPEKRKNTREHPEHEGDGDNPIGDRRKLSMSRSGRLKHAYKKRHSLSLELYGNEDDMPQTEKPKSLEYHVHQPMPDTKETRRRSLDATSSTTKNGAKSPEEEIDSAFEIIDKS